jgi:hypothetical protein
MDLPYGLCEKEVMILGLNAKILEDGIRPESFHMILSPIQTLSVMLVGEEAYPIFNLTVSDRIMYPVTCHFVREGARRPVGFLKGVFLPGPLAAARASSPMKKSRSSAPRLDERAPVPPVRYDGLFATAGFPEPPPTPPLIAMAVGKTNEGASLRAKRCGCQSRRDGDVSVGP